MFIVSGVKDLILSVDEIAKQGYSIKNIIKRVRIIAAFLILFDLFLNYWNVMEFIPWSTMPLWNENIRNVIKEYMVVSMCFWAIYRLILEKILRGIIIHIDKSEDEVLIPIWFTLDDFVDTFFALYFLAGGVNILIEFCNGFNDSDSYKGIYIGAVVYIVGVFLKWLYIQNSNMWYYIRKRYTEFYDCEGKRIPQDAYVVYYGKRYRVYWSGDISGLYADIMCKEWRISPIIAGGKSYSLEEAVKDKEGKLVLDKWKFSATDES